MLRPVSERLLERILLFGPAGSGKSTAAASIASMAAKTKSDARFHVIDTDLAWDRMLIEGYPELTNVEVYVALDWPEYREALSKIRSVVRPNDWVVVDLASNAWETVQAYFTEQVFDRDIGDYFLQVRKELKTGKKSLEAFSGWVDWSVINAMYKTWINDLLFKTRANVICTAKMEGLRRAGRQGDAAPLRHPRRQAGRPEGPGLPVPHRSPDGGTEKQRPDRISPDNGEGPGTGPARQGRGQKVRPRLPGESRGVAAVIVNPRALGNDWLFGRERWDNLALVDAKANSIATAESEQAERDVVDWLRDHPRRPLTEWCELTDPFEAAGWEDWNPVRSVRLATPGRARPLPVPAPIAPTRPPLPRADELAAILRCS